MKTVIRRLFALIGCLSIAAASVMHVAAGSDKEYSWYCVHRKDHKQPIADLASSFTEEQGCYYVDKKHGDDCEDKVIYLTFDAGYENGNVEKILNVLKEEQVTGAFFVLGNLIIKNPELINRMFDEGHLVCNHTFSHKAIVVQSEAELESDIKKLEDTCYAKTGKQMAKYFRPPEGRFSENSLNLVKNLGYKTIFWSFAYADWDNQKQMSCESAKAKILENVHNGEIMLLHPTSETNASVLGDVIRELKNQGYRFGSLDEL